MAGCLPSCELHVLGVVAVHSTASFAPRWKKQGESSGIQGGTSRLRMRAIHPPGGPAPRDGGLHVTTLGIHLGSIHSVLIRQMGRGRDMGRRDGPKELDYLGTYGGRREVAFLVTWMVPVPDTREPTLGLRKAAGLRSRPWTACCTAK